jgi:single-stranded DNA-binding protein
MVTGRLRQRSWETPEGEKRSVTELEADEVGASGQVIRHRLSRAGDRKLNHALYMMAMVQVRRPSAG